MRLEHVHNITPVMSSFREGFILAKGRENKTLASFSLFAISLSMSLSRDFRATVTPLLVFLIVLNIIGFLGNAIVFFIYMFRYKRNQFRRLILALCFVDLVSCCTTVPMETVSTWYWFDSPSIALCKLKNFFVQFSVMSATYMLFVTAVYKYRRICRPFSTQMTHKSIVIYCCFGVCLSAFLAIPAPVLWSINNQTEGWKSTSDDVFVCEINNVYRGTIFPAVYRIILAVYDIFLVLAAVVLYIIVAKVAVCHFHRMKGRTKSANETSISNGLAASRAGTSKSDSGVLENDKSEPPTQLETYSNSTSENNIARQPQTNKAEEKRGTMKNTHQIVRKAETNVTLVGIEIEIPAQTTEEPGNVVRSRGRQQFLSKSQLRSVFMMVIITGTFAITYILGFSFGFIFALWRFSDFDSLGDLAFMFSFYRLYFINYAINPIIYFAMDMRFRQEVIKLSSQLCAVVSR